MKDPYTEIEYQCASMIDYLSALYEEETLESLGNLHEAILKALTAQMELRYQKAAGQPVDHLSAQTLTIEFKDETQHRIYRRSLPMEYEENNNGIELKGEDIHGKPASIAFLSNTAADKIMALTGIGWENPRCNHDD
ncbi:MAG: hypothetical protein Q4F24_02685 [Eubacteriales bacterium]|nr:hypothetical protein [Eubacteriales bacterium]